MCTWADSLRLTGNVAAELTKCSSADQLQPKPTECQVDQKDQVQLSDCSWANRSKLDWEIAGVLDVCSWTHWLLAGCVQRSRQCAAIADRLQASWQFAAKLSCLSWQVAAKLSGWRNAAGCYACSIDMLKASQEIQWLQTNGSCSILHLAISTSAVSSNLFLTLKKFWIFNFASSISCTIKCPSALDFRSPYPKSTTAVLLLQREMRCISSVMLNASQHIHFINKYLLFNFASSISYTIKCPSALGFRLPYPKSTIAVLLLKKEMRCISSVMLNAAQYIHFINNVCNCSILHFRYINVSNLAQSFLWH